MKILVFLAAQLIACLLVVAAHAQNNLPHLYNTAPPPNLPLDPDRDRLGIVQGDSPGVFKYATTRAIVESVGVATNYVVVNNAGLAAKASTAAAAFWRLGYATAEDGGTALYTPGSGACSLNGGTGDGGSEVPSADGKCWLLSWQATRITPKVWGAVGDGTYDDTVNLQAAIDAAGVQSGRTLFMVDGIYKISSGLAVAAPMVLDGQYSGPGHSKVDPNAENCTTGLRIGSANLAKAINVTAPGVAVRNVCIDAPGLTNTSGSAIYLSAENDYATDNNIINACYSIDVSSTGTSNTSVNSHVIGNYITPAPHTACAGIRVGKNSTTSATGPNTTEAYVQNNEILCSSNSGPDGIQIYDLGGGYFQSQGIVNCRYGLYVVPGANQSASGLFFSGGVTGDSSGVHNLFIDTGASSAVVSQLFFTGIWASSSVNDADVLIQDVGAGYVGGIHFSNFYVTTSAYAQNGMNIVAGEDITVVDSRVCSPVASANSMIQVTTGGAVKIDHNTIGACGDQLPITYTVANCVAFVPPGAGSVTITGNTFRSCVAPIDYAPGALSPTVLKDNAGIDDIAFATIGSTTDMDIGILSTMFISGTDNIKNITPVWAGRAIDLVPLAGWATIGGGNVGTDFTASPGKVAHGVFNGTNWNFGGY